IPSTRSSAATKCISEVPGLAKHSSTPPPTSVRTRLSAPFTRVPPVFWCGRAYSVAARSSSRVGRRLGEGGGEPEAEDADQPADDARPEHRAVAAGELPDQRREIGRAGAREGRRQRQRTVHRAVPLAPEQVGDGGAAENRHHPVPRAVDRREE